MQVLGKIIDSESHVCYRSRIYDASEHPTPPNRHHFSLGSFVCIYPKDTSYTAQPSPSEEKIVGLIANSQLINPDTGHHGPRLTIPHQDNTLFAPDYIQEIGTMISILLIGQLTTHGIQGIPPNVIPVGSEVHTCSDDEIIQFHRDEKGRFQFRYFSLLAQNDVTFSSHILNSICQKLHPLCHVGDRRILKMLQKHILWQSTLGSMR